MEINKNFWIIFGIGVVLVILIVVGVVVHSNSTNKNNGDNNNNNYTCFNGTCQQVSDCSIENCTSKEDCEKTCKKPSPPPPPKPTLLPPYKNGTLDKCLSDTNACIDCKNKTIKDVDDRGIYCGVLKTPGIVCNDVFNSFFNNLGLNGFDYIQGNSQYYTDYTDPIGALQVAGKNYKNYNSNELIERKIDLRVIKTILDLAVPNNDKISVFLVQAPLSFVNVSISKIVSKLNGYKAKYPLLSKNIDYLINTIQTKSINKKTITGEDLGLYHSGLVFIKTSDYKSSKNFPSDKIITSLELWGNILDSNTSLWGSALPKLNKNGTIDTSGLVNNIIVSTSPQVFGCTAKEYFGDYWDVQYYLGDTTKDIIVQLFSASQDWYQENPIYISQAVTSNYDRNKPPCLGDKSSYIRSITCETFAIDMIKKLINLDSKNFNQSVFKNLKFTEIAVIGSTYEILDNITQDQVTNINTYSQNIEKSIMPSYGNVFLATKPSPIPAIGNELNKLLSLGTSTILEHIAKETNTMYTVVIINSKPKICKISGEPFWKPLYIDIIYDECPANM